MIVELNLIIQELEFTPETKDEFDPANTIPESMEHVGSDTSGFPLTISKLEYWFYNDKSLKVCIEGLGIMEFDHNLLEFENKLRDSMRGKEKLLLRREIEILEYLVKKEHGDSVSGNMFEG